jgi:DNA-binding transcriptional MocR family regulator
MTTSLQRWNKVLSTKHGRPAYLLIADLIDEDVNSGRLQPRDRLPTLRELASALNINYTTAARGYAEARRRGLVDSHPGSGTFVKGKSPAVQLGRGGYDMTMNMTVEPAIPSVVELVRGSAVRLLSRHDLYSLLRYQEFGGNQADREAAMHWLSYRLTNVAMDRVLVCPGIHSTLVALMTQVVSPGGVVCVDSLVYPGVKAIAAQLGLRLHPMDRDADGPLVKPLEDICKTGRVGALYLNPTLHNPTAVTIPRGRREALADVALRYSIPIIEDDAYAMLPPDDIVPIATLAPELTYYVTGMSKCFGAGMRTAFLHAPSRQHAQRAAGALRALTVMASPITNALVTQWIQDGTADAMLKSIRAEAQVRQGFAAKYLARHRYHTGPGAFHLWVKLPKGSDWNTSELAAHLRANGVSAVASAAFSTDNNPPDAFRLCLGGPVGREECEEALQQVADVIERPAHLSSAVH